MPILSGYNESGQESTDRQRPTQAAGWDIDKRVWGAMKRLAGVPEEQMSDDQAGQVSTDPEDSDLTTEEIMEIQEEMKRLRFYDGEADGVIDQRLMEAVKRAVEVSEGDEQQPMEGHPQDTPPRRSAADSKEHKYDETALSRILN